MYNEFEHILQKIKRDLFLIPFIAITVIFIILLSIIYFSLQQYSINEAKDIRKNIISQQKDYSHEKLKEALFLIQQKEKQTQLILKESLMEKIEDAQKIISALLKTNQNNTDIVKKQTIAILSQMHFFGNRGYFFIYNYTNNKIISHPRKEFINKDMSNYKDLHNQVLVNVYKKAMNNKNKEGFATIYFKKPFSKDSDQYKKMTFVKYIPELDWVIGTGEYIDVVENKLKQEIITTLEKKRFNNNGYYWIHSNEYKLLMHPYRKQYIDTNDKNITDIKGKKVIQAFIINAMKNYPNSANVNYFWNKPGSKEIIEKISYVHYFPKWKWIIGTGVYLDDIDKIIKQRTTIVYDELKNIFIKILLIFIIAYIISIYKAIQTNKNLQLLFKNYTQKLDNTNNELEKKVIERTKQLDNLNHSLEKKIKQAVEENRQKDIQLYEQTKSAQLGEMIENIAHQWRQPLSVISTISTGTLVELDYGSCNKDDIKKKFETINSSSQHLSNTINQFSSFIKEERIETTIVVQKRLNKAIDVIEASLTFDDIKILKEYDKDELEVKIVYGELIQVVINIINNAKDMLKTKEQERWIKINAFKDEHSAVITIEDNGGGIDDSIIDKIFEPYFTTKHQSQGTGIGLYMSKKIIEQNNQGKLSVSNTNNGAMFKIILPLL